MIDTLTPLNLLILSLATFLTTILVGHASKEAFLKPIKTLFGIGSNIVLGGTLERFLVYSALGFAFIIVYTIVLSLFTFLNQIGVFAIVGFALIVELTILLQRKKGASRTISGFVRIVKKKIKSFATDSGQIILLGLLIAAIIWYFYPAIGLSSYPGGDDRAYIFVAKQIVDRGTVFITIDYPYAYPYMDHLFMAGFMAVTSFFYNLLQVVGLPTAIPVLDLFLPLICLSLTPGSIYVLTLELSKNKEFSITVALTALFLWKSIVLYFSWGGVAEALGYFLIPVFALIDYELNENLVRSRFGVKAFTGRLIVKFVLLVIVMYINIYSVFLFIFLVMVVTPLWTIKNYVGGSSNCIREKVKNYVKTVLPYLMIFCGLIIMVVGAVTLSELNGSRSPALDRLYSFFFSNPTDILNYQFQAQWTAPWLVLRNGYGLDYTVSRLAFVLDFFFGGPIFLLIALYLLFLVYLSMPKNKEQSLRIEQRTAVKLTNAMAATALIFFLFIQNSPFGLYYLPYPMAKSVLAVRLYYELSTFMIYVEALPIYLIYVYVRKIVVTFSTGSRKESSHGSTVTSEKHVTLKKVGVTALLVLLVVSIALPSVSNYYSHYVNSREESIVTSHDLEAFHWIEVNTPTNATFFVNLGDAGGYVYVYTGRIVLPPESLRAWSKSNQAWQSFNETEIMLQEGNTSLRLIQLLKGYNVSYVYVGEKVQYEGPQFNTTALIQSSHFEVAFHQGGVWVFKVKST